MGYEEFEQRIREAATEFKKIGNENIRIISHLDSDGISSAAIIVKAMKLLGKKFTLSVIPQLDKAAIELFAKEKYNVYVFTDLGSGSILHLQKYLAGRKIFVLDHHKPENDVSKIKISEHIKNCSNEDSINKNINSQKAVFNGNDIFHVNPHLFGNDGGNDISGSGVSYLFAKELDPMIKDMAWVAVVGMIGDVQVENISPINQSIISESSKQVDELREFSTVLNACGRLSRSGIGVGACLGDPEMKKKAYECYALYRAELLKAMEWYNDNKETKNVISGDGFIIINAQDKILGTIIGTIASMITKSGDVPQGNIVMSMAHLVDNNTKISLRIAGRKDDVDLREVIKEIIVKLKAGEFGGHKAAAGAIIPTNKEEELISIAKQVLEKKGMEESVS